MRHDERVTRRTGALLAGLLGALLVGGVSQAFLWRWGLGAVSTVTDSQFLWVLLTFGVAWAWAEGRVGQGALAGGATGLALIVSYYAMQWVADGRHSATAQFTRAAGPAWTLAAVAGGAAMGVLGALAGTSSRHRPRRKAFGIATPALLVAAGPVLWMLAESRYVPLAHVAPAAAVFVLVGAGLLAYAVRTCGRRVCVQATVLATGLSAVGLGGLWWLQTHGWLYLTF